MVPNREKNAAIIFIPNQSMKINEGIIVPVMMTTSKAANPFRSLLSFRRV